EAQPADAKRGRLSASPSLRRISISSRDQRFLPPLAFALVAGLALAATFLSAVALAGFAAAFDLSGRLAFLSFLAALAGLADFPGLAALALPPVVSPAATADATRRRRPFRRM